MTHLLLLRRKDWRIRLATALEAMERTPHSWGEHDCALGLAGSVVEAVTGADIVAPWRGRYATDEEALNVLSAEGCARLDQLVERLLPAIAPADARLGDLAFVPGGAFGGFLGVFIGERIAVLGLTGKATMARTVATRAFLVGE